MLEGRLKLVDLNGMEKHVDDISWKTTVGELLCRLESSLCVLKSSHPVHTDVGRFFA